MDTSCDFFWNKSQTTTVFVFSPSPFFISLSTFREKQRYRRPGASNYDRLLPGSIPRLILYTLVFHVLSRVGSGSALPSLVNFHRNFVISRIISAPSTRKVYVRRISYYHTINSVLAGRHFQKLHWNEAQLSTQIRWYIFLISYFFNTSLQVWVYDTRCNAVLVWAALMALQGLHDYCWKIPTYQMLHGDIAGIISPRIYSQLPPPSRDARNFLSRR